jgi:hypothetical protein
VPAPDGFDRGAAEARARLERQQQGLPPQVQEDAVYERLAALLDLPGDELA